MMIRLLTHIWVTRPQWVKPVGTNLNNFLSSFCVEKYAFESVYKIWSILFIPQSVRSLSPGGVLWCERAGSVLAQVMLPNGTKPLLEPMLTSHQRCSVGFPWGEPFHKKCSWTSSITCVKRLHFWNYYHIAQEPVCQIEIFVCPLIDVSMVRL